MMAEKKSRGGRRLASAASVWALLAKSSFYKVLAVALLLAAIETILFYRALQGAASASFEWSIGRSRMHILFLAALGAVFFLLIRAGRVLDDEGRYTVMRLRVPPAGIFAIRTVYDMLCLALMFAVQTGLAIWFAEIYRRTPGAPDWPQLVFMAFYRDEFLHCLLPMAETGKWVRNGLMLLALAMEEAGGIGKRYRTTQVGVFVMAAAWFAAPIGWVWQDAVCCFVYVVVIAADLWDLWKACRPEEGRAGSGMGAEP